MEDPADDRPGETAGFLERKVRNGLRWSLVNTLVGRLGSFLTGIVIARIVAPEDFGIYAVALVALNLLLSMNELGVSVALVRHPGSVAALAPTVTTVAIGMSAVLFAASWFAAAPFSDAMGVPEATGVVRLMSAAVLIDGLAAVPVALLTRAFMQGRRTQIDLIAFAVGTPATILLAMAGYGAWSLAWGVVIGNLVTAVLSLVYAPTRYAPGFDRKAALGLLKFGLPLAGASLLLLALLNVDFVVVGRILGKADLGLYLLAFNLSTWPMTLVSTAARRVTTAMFAQLSERGDGREGFRDSLFLVMSLGMLLGTLLAAYASGIVTFLYGDRWAAAALAVPALAMLSIGRMLVELTYDYLVAVGRTMGNAWLHALWLVALVPTLVVGATMFGIRGVSWGHAAIVALVVVPGVGILLHRAGIPVWRLLADFVLPAAGSAGVLLSAWFITSVIPSGFLMLAVGGLAGLAVYALIVGPRFVRILRRLLDLGEPRAGKRKRIPAWLTGASSS
ncbi:oligosaccharide flippase family protein [Cryobacterium sp. HLT2-28]|uniref:oligosaccharide flippase family protein n=1 Tax=Cryobacterium sp. HLT2-28 TaxID=1259146 RepID=UPI00106A3D90|nr:oligosaccharide flippase family protein [Cryobacterium sp. HLT2-28]TFB91723.1 lipopolysaccharide biosynthesis protein [Cryobacterium sp. HLT2-28]